VKEGKKENEGESRQDRQSYGRPKKQTAGKESGGLKPVRNKEWKDEKKKVITKKKKHLVKSNRIRWLPAE